MTMHLSKYTMHINYLYGMFIRQQDTLSCYIWYQHIIIQLVSYSYLLEISDKCTGVYVLFIDWSDKEEVKGSAWTGAEA